MTISVLLVDDHEIVRKGLRTVLAQDSNIDLVGEAATGEEALVAAKALDPDVMVLDLALPGISGFEVTRHIASHGDHTRVLVLSMHADDAYVMEALRCGAHGYLLKEAPASELITGVRSVGNGQYFLSTAISDRARESFDSAREKTAPTAFSTLTKRELQVLAQVGEGITSREIGEHLGIGTRTVETHRAHIMHKLGLRTHNDLISFAVRHNLLTKPSSI